VGSFETGRIHYLRRLQPVWASIAARPDFTPKIAVDAFVKIFDPYVELIHKDYQLVVRKTMNPDNVALDTYKQLRPVLIELQQALR
jgi:hypothetical protein